MVALEVVVLVVAVLVEAVGTEAMYDERLTDHHMLTVALEEYSDEVTDCIHMDHTYLPGISHVGVSLAMDSFHQPNLACVD